MAQPVGSIHPKPIRIRSIPNIHQLSGHSFSILLHLPWTIHSQLSLHLQILRIHPRLDDLQNLFHVLIMRLSRRLGMVSGLPRSRPQKAECMMPDRRAQRPRTLINSLMKPRNPQQTNPSRNKTENSGNYPFPRPDRDQRPHLG
jgi:hypothetical protein